MPWSNTDAKLIITIYLVYYIQCFVENYFQRNIALLIIISYVLLIIINVL